MLIFLPAAALTIGIVAILAIARWAGADRQTRRMDSVNRSIWR